MANYASLEAIYEAHKEIRNKFLIYIRIIQVHLWWRPSS